MGNRSFFNALHDREGDFLLATVLEGPAQGERPPVLRRHILDQCAQCGEKVILRHSRVPP